MVGGEKIFTGDVFYLEILLRLLRRRFVFRGNAHVAAVAFVSDDGCDARINGTQWLKESGKGHDISKGLRRYGKLLLPAGTWELWIMMGFGYMQTLTMYAKR